MQNKLVIDCLGFVSGRAFGFQEMLFNLLDYLHRKRNELHYSDIIIACKSSECNAFSRYTDDFKVSGIQSAESYLGSLWMRDRLANVFGLKKTDTILYPGNFSGLKKQCKQVLIIHDLLYKHQDLLPSRLMRLQRNFYVPYSIKAADFVVCISQFTADEVRHYYPYAADKTKVIYNYMNLGKYNSKPADNYSDYFLAVSSNAYHKDLGTLFRAFDIYVNKGGNNTLCLIGGVSEQSEAGKALSMLPIETRLRILMKRGISNEELGLLYQQASAFISCSRYEGFGMPIAEAMFFNLPIILTDIEVHHEISQDNACFFPVQDSEALANLMLTTVFARQTYSSLSEQRYGEENTSKRYLDLLNQLAI